MTYNQFVPYTDRLDYLAPLANNAAYDSGREISESRSRNAARPYVCSRVNSLEYRLICRFGSISMDVGALTVFMITFTEREKLYKLFEELTELVSRRATRGSGSDKGYA